MDPLMQDDAQSAAIFADQFTQLMTQTGSSIIDLVSNLNFFILVPIFCAVGVLMTGYFKQYQRPAERIQASLRQIVDDIRATQNRQEVPAEELRYALDSIFDASALKGLWMEYCASLRAMPSRDGTARKTVMSTVPAEVFFNKESIVDLKINVEFYRHLPGILTGIGIIGTFSGLVWGLHEFRPESAEALSSLPILLQEVTSAFIGSGLAILAAIYITYKEKSILNQCYRAVEDLTKEIDALYAVGAGEEYLARLVYAAENNAALISEAIASSIKSALAEPMQDLGMVVKRVSQSQEQAVGELLDDALKSFLVRLEDTFGRQISDLNGSFQKSSQAMEHVESAMKMLVDDMAKVSASSVDRVSSTLADSMMMAATAQEQMNQQMRQFMDELRDLLVRQQSQSSDIMDVTMRAVLSKLQGAIAKLSTDRSEQIEQDRKRYDALTASVATLAESMDRTATKTSENLGAIQSAATGAINGMNNGAVVMRMAADRFTLAGNTLSGALEQSQALADSLKQLQAVVDSVSQFRKAG